MMEQYKISYQNVGQNTYLVVEFGESATIVESMMGTITSNSISHFLEAFRLMINGETVVRYQVSSKQTLSTMLKSGDRKLKISEVVSIIDGAVQALKEAAEYRLPDSGLVVDPDYIFVDPRTFDPGFVYLPVKVEEGNGLKKLILDLVISGKIELSSSNFVQLLLETVQTEPFSLEQLENCISPFKGGKSVPGTGTNRTPSGGYTPPVNPVPIPVPQPDLSAAKAQVPVTPQPIPYQVPPAPVQPPVDEGMPLSGPGKRPEKPPTSGKGKKFSKPPKPEKKGKRAEKALVEAGEPDESGFDAQAAKKKFLLPQALVMVALAASISFGLFLDENGALVINNLLAVVIVVALFEVILYREIYVNGKQPKAKKAKKKAGGKKASGPVPPVKPQRGVPVPPSRGNAPVPPVTAQPLQMQQKPAAPTPVPTPAPAPAPVPQAYAAPRTAPIPVPMPIGDQPTMLNEEMDATELIGPGDMEGAAPYLEYVENGRPVTYPLCGESILVGHLSGKVNLVIHNPKVGRIHAEFLVQNGQIYVKDLNSLNGTYLNGSAQRITSNVPYPLKDQDKITLANCELTLHCRPR